MPMLLERAPVLLCTSAADAFRDAVRESLTPVDRWEWDTLANRVYPIDAARQITGGRAGARVYID